MDKSKYVFFRKRDIFVYTAIVIITAVLFLIPFSGKNSADRFVVSLYGETVYEYDCKTGKGVSYSDCVTENKENGAVFVTVERDGNRNTIKFADGTAEMTESNCRGKECVDFFAPLSGSGVIVCLPHGLKITGVSGGEIVVPVG